MHGETARILNQDNEPRMKARVSILRNIPIMVSYVIGLSVCFEPDISQKLKV